MALALVALEITGTAGGGVLALPTVIVSVTAALVPLAFDAVRWVVIVPAAEGVPEMTPVVVFSVKPVPVRLSAA